VEQRETRKDGSPGERMQKERMIYFLKKNDRRVFPDGKPSEKLRGRKRTVSSAKGQGQLYRIEKNGRKQEKGKRVDSFLHELGRGHGRKGAGKD